MISGVIPQSLGGGYCYAEGSVKGRYNTEIQAHSDREITDRQYLSDALYTFSVKIFNFKINIFKNCGKMPANYDIISKNNFKPVRDFSYGFFVLSKFTHTRKEI